MIATKSTALTALLIVACTIVMALDTAPAVAQMINVQTPFRTNRDSYFERNGIDFGLSFAGNNRIRGLNPAGQILPRVQLTQGSAGETVPGFGGFTPNSPLQTGFTTIGGDIRPSFTLTAGKGFRRSSVSQSPSVTVMNGQTGSIFSGRQVPFVTRIDPVVGMGSGMGTGVGIVHTPLRDRLAIYGMGSPEEYRQSSTTSQETRTWSHEDSSANQGALSIAEIERRKQLSANAGDQKSIAEVQELMATSETLVSQGEFGAARAKLGRALRRVADKPQYRELESEIRSRLTELRNKR